MEKKPLKTRLVDFLNEAKGLPEIYDEFPEDPKHSIRARLSQGCREDDIFKRLAEGVYIASNGDQKALIIEGDARKVVKEFDENSIDCIIIDSPYTAHDKHLKWGTTRKRNLKGSWDWKTFDMDEDFLGDLFRILKKGGHFYSFMPPMASDNMDYIQGHIKLCLKAGFSFNKQLVWDKNRIGMGYNYRNRHELIMFFSKDKRRMPEDRRIPDVLTHTTVLGKKRLWQTQKPVSLYEDLVKVATKPGEVVLEPCAGSFPATKAAYNLGRIGIGIEIEKSGIDHVIEELGAIRA